MASVLWKPDDDRIARSGLAAFTQHLNKTQDAGLHVGDADALHQFSIDRMEDFWGALIDFAGLKAPTWGTAALINGDKMPGAAFFPDAKLNFAENLLRRRDGHDAIVFWGEDRVKRRISWTELYDQVSTLAQALKAAGIRPGDRVAAYMPNMPETVIAMLATTALGATFSSCSPDFGVGGVVDRFGQIEPHVLIAAESYVYNGKTIDMIPKLAGVLAKLPTVARAVIVPYLNEDPDIGHAPQMVMLDDFTKPFSPEFKIPFEPVAFNHPLYILYSSGTTGVPKCIVHSTGGVLLKHASEHLLHADVRPGDRVFYFTTCGWMMWNWLVSALMAEATLLLYDGSPFAAGGSILFDYADAEKMTLLGTSAKYIDHCNKTGMRPRETHDLSSVRAICSTGSPLLPDAFDYVYRDIKADVHLASISGGTDILGCFVLGHPWLPVHRGEIQAKALGLDVQVFDDDGKALSGEKGELVCTRPFPSMPVGFWHDPESKRYRAAYFERFENVWHHGDFIEQTQTGGFIIHGRSDATLNPGGVRIGTAEIYRQVEALDDIKESLVVGQDWEGDVRVVLFVVMQDGVDLTDGLIKTIKNRIKTGCTPRHVPARVIAVADIPRTKSGKIVELAVRDVIHGRAVKNQSALANPEALDLFRDLDALQS